MLTLSDKEIEDLTGYKLPAWQIKWLTSRAWKFEVSAGGRPKVSRKYYEQKMGLVNESAEPDEPDFSILHKAA